MFFKPNTLYDFCPIHAYLCEPKLSQKTVKIENGHSFLQATLGSGVQQLTFWPPQEKVKTIGQTSSDGSLVKDLTVL